MDSLRHETDVTGDKGVAPPDPCSLCRKRYGTSSRSRLAEWYCMHCRQFICDECKANHESSSMFNKHKIITQTKGAETADIFRELSEMETCKTHKDKRLDFFCLAHKSFCCSTCINHSHKICRKIIDVQERNRTHILGPTTDALNVLQNLTRQIEDNERQCASNKKYLGKVKSELPGIFETLKKDIVNILEKVEERATTEINKMIQEEEQKYSDLEAITQALTMRIKKALNLLEISLEHGSDTQKIRTEHEIGAKAKQFNDELKIMQNSTPKPSVEICLQPCFVDLLHDPGNIFKVSVTGTTICPAAASSQISLLSTPQAITTTLQAVTKPFRERNAKFITEVECSTSGDKNKPWITGCKCLFDDRLVVADCWNKKLKLFGHNLYLMDEIVLDGMPWDLTSYDKEELAVTFPDTRKLKLVSVKEAMSITQTLTVPYVCRGISSMNKDRLVVAAERVGVVILDLYGTEISRIRSDEECLKQPYYVALSTTKTVAYVSSYDCHKVCAVDLSSNEVLFTYVHGDLKGPCGVAIDQDDNVYVCGCDSNNVHLVSNDGHLIKILLSNKDGIRYAQSLCFSLDGKWMFVAEDGYQSVRKFDID